jgi:hypothetical protein
MLCCSALFWCCYDAHLDDLPIAGRTGARHSGYSLLRRHETAGATSEGSLWLTWFELLTAMSGNRGNSSSFSGMTRQELQRVWWVMVSSGAGGAMPCTARPAAGEVRNNSKDAIRLMVDGRVLYMSYVVCFDLGTDKTWPTLTASGLPQFRKRIITTPRATSNPIQRFLAKAHHNTASSQYFLFFIVSLIRSLCVVLHFAC